MVIWYIVWSFGIFSYFGTNYQEKIWQPWAKGERKLSKAAKRIDDKLKKKVFS
jgi:hypothetical protein